MRTGYIPTKKETIRDLNGVTLVVQSTDSFSDCWGPFFTLLVKYWPDCKYPIVLNTETKTYQHAGLDIRCTRTKDLFGSRWPTWSETLLACLESVSSELILLILDDLFISGAVEITALNHYVALMQYKKYGNISLTEHGRERPAVMTDDPSLLTVAQRARYRVTTSPALWQKAALRRYLRPEETAWEFEIFGSRRSWRMNDTFFIANPAFLANGAEGVIPYFQDIRDTGIIKGRWQPNIPQFFGANGIEIDYSRRGFYRERPRILKKYDIARLLMRHPVRSARALLGK